MKRIVLLVVLLLGVFYTHAQKQDKIVFNNSTIKLDGELNEPIWTQLDVHDDFIDYMPNNGSVATKQTVVKMFHNGKKLYISAVYHDTTNKVQIGSLKRDDIGNSGANSDSFVIVIDTYNQQQSGYFFIVNMGGTLVDALVSRKGDGYWLSRS